MSRVASSQYKALQPQSESLKEFKGLRGLDTWLRRSNHDDGKPSFSLDSEVCTGLKILEVVLFESVSAAQTWPSCRGFGQQSDLCRRLHKREPGWAHLRGRVRNLRNGVGP